MWRSAVTFVATIPVLVALSVLPLLTPAFGNPALDLAGSARLLDMDAAAVRELSDRSVVELVMGPGSFDLSGPDGRPFYDAAERAHLRDARTLLWLVLLAGALSALLIGLLMATAGPARRSLWRAVSRAGAVSAVGVVVIGMVGLVAFDPLFTLFHEVLFPGGGWAFDPATQRLVRLYPVAFWQLAAVAFGVLLLGLGMAAWWLGRRLATSPADSPTLAASEPGQTERSTDPATDRSER